MKIALYGSTGRIGRRILNEALSRGHEVTAIVRDASHSNQSRPHLEFKTGDVLKPESVVAATKGNNVVISAYGPGAGDANQITAAAKSLVEGVGANQPMRLVVVGGREVSKWRREFNWLTGQISPQHTRKWLWPIAMRCKFIGWRPLTGRL